MNTKNKRVFQRVLFALSAFALIVVQPAEAAPKKKSIKNSAMAEYEGEYSIENNRVRKTSRKPASVKKKSKTQKKKPAKVHASKKKSSKNKKYSARVSRDHSGKARSPASVVKKNKKSKKLTKRQRQIELKAKHAKKKKSAKKKAPRVSKRHDSKRLPYAKDTRNERDMPFISVPTTKVRRENTQMVMEDPEATPESPPLALDPQFDEPSVSEATPPMETPPLVDAAREPASAPEVYGPPMRQPDAFDLHSGADPMSP